MNTKIALRYTGPAVDAGQMEVYQVAANMVAFSQFMTLVAKQTYGPEVFTRAEVAGFGRGSFVTDLVFNVVGVSATVFSAVSPSDLLMVLKEAIDLWKHLRGSPPAAIEHNNNGGVVVTNNNGTIINVSAPALSIVISDRGTEAVEQFVRKALAPEGMDGLSLESNAQQLTTISQSESGYFVPVAPSEMIAESVIKMGLSIEAPVFKDGNKWRFSDGNQSFFADIEDEDFIGRVNAGESFAKGDVLVADVRFTQERSGMRLSADRTIVKVHRHDRAPSQLVIK